MTKSTKGALTSSVIAIVLCLAMLIGTTFAWFTDSASSTGNVIKAGTLTVEFYYADGTEAPATADWQNADNVAILDYDNWEPGYVMARHIKVSNTGSLDLKFNLSIVPYGEVSKLAEVIDVYYAVPGTQLDGRADLDDMTKRGTLADLINTGIADENLFSGDDYTATIALKMREDAGNEYQNLSIGDSFTINLFASQLASEYDSFGNDYDADADFLSKDANGNWLVRNATELRYLSYKVNAGTSYEGETILLANDIDLGGINWIPIGNPSKGFSGTFDGQNYTISNYKVKGVNCVGLFGYALNGGNIKNLKVNDATVTANDYAGAILGRGYTDIVNCHAENVTVTVTPYKLSDGSYDGGAKAGAIVGQLLEGGSTMTGCTAKNVTVLGYRDIGAVLGMAHDNNTVTDCAAYDSEVAYQLLDAGSKYDGNTRNENVGAVVGRVQASATVTGSVAENVDVNSAYVYGLKLTRNPGNSANHGTITVSSKEALLNLTKLNDDWAALFTNGQGDSYDNYYVKSYYYKDTWTVVLTTDVDLGSMARSINAIEPIDLGKFKFFDGQGHTIKNAVIIADETAKCEVGLFDASECGVKNLCLDNITVKGSLVGNSCAGVLSGSCTKGIENVTVTNSSVWGGKYTGAIIGYGYSDITDSTVTSTTVVGGYKVGALAGYLCAENGTRTVSGNTVKGVTVDGIGNGVYADGKNAYVVGTLVGHFYADGEISGNETEGVIGSASETVGLVQVGSTVNGYELIADGLATKGDEYRIYNANGFYAFAEMVNDPSKAEGEGNTFAGKTVLLMNDVDFGGAEWDPIGNFGRTGKYFAGSFDGQGYTVSNFKITEKTADRAGKNRSPHGFFGNVTGTVKNLTVANSTLEVLNDGRYAGILVGRLINSYIENCHVVNCDVETSYWQVGALVGQVDTAGEIIGCSVSGTTVTGPASVGAIVGIQLAGTLTIRNCSVDGCAIENNNNWAEKYSDPDYDTMFGAIIGTVNASTCELNVINCTVTNTTVYHAENNTAIGYMEPGATFDDTDFTPVSNVEELEAALANGGVIKLKNDITFTDVIQSHITIPAGVDVTLNLNGHTLTASYKSHAIISKGNLTVKNGYALVVAISINVLS